MSVRSGQAITIEFTTASFSTGAATNADSLPTGTLVVNGVDNAATVTVTNIDTGRYKAAVTLPTLAIGDVVELSIAATVSTVAGKAIVWRDTKDVLLDTSGDVTFNNTTIATATNLTNLPAIPNNWLTAAGIAAGALNGKGDWLLASSYVTPPTVAQIATGVWTDTTASDFTTVGSPGKVLITNLDATISSRMATFTLPTNFSSLAIDASGRVDLGKILGTASAGAAGSVSIDWANIVNAAAPVNLLRTTISIVSGVTGGVTLTEDEHILLAKDFRGPWKNIYYISPSGNNSNDGKTSSTAWLDLTNIPTTCVAGDAVLIAPGQYNFAGFTLPTGVHLFGLDCDSTKLLCTSSADGHGININGQFGGLHDLTIGVSGFTNATTLYLGKTSNVSDFVIERCRIQTLSTATATIATDATNGASFRILRSDVSCAGASGIVSNSVAETLNLYRVRFTGGVNGSTVSVKGLMLLSDCEDVSGSALGLQTVAGGVIRISNSSYDPTKAGGAGTITLLPSPVNVAYWRNALPSVLQGGRVDGYTGAMAANVVDASQFTQAAADKVWTSAARTLTAFAFNVIVGGYAANQDPYTLVAKQVMTEGYTTGAFTLEQALYEIAQVVGQNSVSGLVITVQKRDKSTPAATFDVDDATNPTLRTRAS